MYFPVMLFVDSVLLCMSYQPHFDICICRCGWALPLRHSSLQWCRVSTRLRHGLHRRSARAHVGLPVYFFRSNSTSNFSYFRYPQQWLPISSTTKPAQRQQRHQAVPSRSQQIREKNSSSHGLRNSMPWLLPRTCFENIWLTKGSRPKTLDDVAAQDHTTKVLSRTLNASNVCSILSRMISTIP